MFARKTLSFLLVMIALFGLAGRSRAQFDYVEQTGVVTMDKVNGITVYVFADQYKSSDPTSAFPLSGKVSLYGLNGNQFLGMDTTVKTLAIAPDPASLTGAMRATLKTNDFYYYDTNTGKYLLAYAYVVLYNDGRGKMAFQIITQKNGKQRGGVTLATSVDAATGDWYAPLLTGYTSIYSF